MSKEKSKRSMRGGGRVWEWEVEGGGGGNFALRVRSSNFEVRRWNFEVRWFQLSPNFEEKKKKETKSENIIGRNAQLQDAQMDCT